MSANTENRKEPKISKSNANLSSTENELVFALIGRKCQSLCTSVAQLYLTEGPHHLHWLKRHTGVLCFIKDSTRRSYFMRMFCLSMQELVWEHEIYDEMDIIQSKPFLLTFEGQECMVALNFTSVEEASEFKNVVATIIRNRNRKKEERINRIKPTRPAPAPVTNSKPSDDLVPLRNSTNICKSFLLTEQQVSIPRQDTSIKLKKKKRGAKITTADISTPSNFTHISHVGFKSEDAFDLSGENVALRPFLQKAGISEEHLNNRQTRNFIYDFIQKNNVQEIAQKEAMQRDPPPVPPKNPNILGRGLPPAPPVNRDNHQELPAPKPAIASKPSNQIASSRVPPPPVMPIPPIPPPLLDMNMPQQTSSTKPKSSQSAMISKDPRDELLESIRSGAKLRKVEASTTPAPVVANDPRGCLLNQIRAGKELRPVSASSKDNSTTGSIGTDALADALNQALKKRQLAIDGSSPSGSEVSDNDEWID